jgi:hypothetical protein
MPMQRRYHEPFLQDAEGNLHHPHTNEIVGRIEEPTAAVEPTTIEGPRALRLDAPGTYLLLDDVVAIMRVLADEYEAAGNPSAALALREVADAWTQ